MLYSAITRLADAGGGGIRDGRAILARLPEYRLSKFQRCLPERWAVEMVGGTC